MKNGNYRQLHGRSCCLLTCKLKEITDNKLLRKVENQRSKSLYEKRQKLDSDRKHGKPYNKQRKKFRENKQDCCPYLPAIMPFPFISVICFREEGMIHFFYRSHAKKPESGLFSDWIGNNTDDLLCSDWPKSCHQLVVVDFSLHFCLRINEQ